MAAQIYEALAKIMEETNAIGKTNKNQSQGFMFRGIDDIVNDLHNIFARNKVFIVPEVVDYTVSEKTTAKGALMYYTRAKIKFHATTTDGSEVVITNVGEAMDSGDKGMNKAMSIALKYALIQLLLIPTQEQKDPDAVTVPETRKPTVEEELKRLDPVQDATLKQVIEQILAAESTDELLSIYNEFKDFFKDNALFMRSLSQRRSEVAKKAAKK